MATLVRELPFCGFLGSRPQQEVTRAVLDLFPGMERVYHVDAIEHTWPPFKVLFRDHYSELTKNFGSFRKKQLSLRITSRLLDTWPHIARFSEVSSVVSAVHEIQYEYELFLALTNGAIAEKLQRLIDHCRECVPLGARIADQRSIVVLWF